MKSDFKEFLNINNYERRYSNTYKRMDSEEGFICDEHLMVNTYYQPQENPNPNNTYQYELAMNHHNILLKGDYEYYERCVQRFQNLLDTQKPIIFLNIQPVIPFADFEKNREHIIESIQQFDNFLYANHCEDCAPSMDVPMHTIPSVPLVTGLYFIMVQHTPNHAIENGEQEQSTQMQCNESIQYECMRNTNSRIHILFVNPDFIDAGETFMGNCNHEREYIENIILSYVDLYKERSQDK
jgi:hypothetical protein